MKYVTIFFAFVIGYLLGCFTAEFVFKETELISPLVKELPTEVLAVGNTWVGDASWYGTGVNECLGCNKNRIMANGKKLDDSKLTVACGIKSSCQYLKIGDKVLITNLKNSKQVEAVVTDRGGLRKGRILDVSKAVKNKLEMGDVGKIELKKI